MNREIRIDENSFSLGGLEISKMAMTKQDMFALRHSASLSRVDGARPSGPKGVA
jgi:hypothetical protein